ncbi:unnamed protein product [Parajaminaea phylloscopi]
MVDQSVRLPPRKTKTTPRSLTAPDPSASQLAATIPPRSPLSPLHPASPLFPDGLIAPIWARKHKEIVPSAFVCFYCLADPYIRESATTSSSASPPAVARQEEPDAAGSPEEEVEAPLPRSIPGHELKARDDELVRLISERKRSLVERGIKLTVVLLTTRDVLESAQLEPRLSYIRRSSGLDSKASLFVLTPVSRPELFDFVTSLQGALYDHALDYYREHARRVRRKRTRYPPPVAVVQPILQSVAATRVGSKAPELTPLSREGWHVRAEFKLAMFAEFSADYPLALAHYQEAYDLLAGPRGMMSSTALLPPRTKRWAEAKALSDTLTVRMCKLHLYADDANGALSKFRTHLARFAELSSGWGIGDATFEYWSWLGKQYRLMAGIMEQATRANSNPRTPPITLTGHAPPLPSFLLHPDVADDPQRYPSLRMLQGSLLSPNAAAMASGVGPASLLQGPAVYFYIAALCILERRSRFKRMSLQESGGELSEGAMAALVHEKTVDHCGQAVEVLERARELYQEAGLAGSAMLVAFRIATTYADNDHHSQALEVLKRIITSTPLDVSEPSAWMVVLLAIRCTERVSDKDSPIELGLMLVLRALSLAGSIHSRRPSQSIELSSTFDPIESELEIIANRWSSLARRTSLGEHETTSTEAPIAEYAGSVGPLRAVAVFRHDTVAHQGTVPLQITLWSPQPLSHNGLALSYNSLRIFDQDQREVATFRHSDEAEVTGNVLFTHCRSDDETITSTPAFLTWQPGDVKVFQCSLLAEKIGDLSISRVQLDASDPLPYSLLLDLTKGSPMPALAAAPAWIVESANSRRWIALEHRANSDVPGSCQVTRPTHRLKIAMQDPQTSYLDERITTTVEVKNDEKYPLMCTMDGSLSSASSSAQDELTLSCGVPESGNTSPSVLLGELAPGESRSVTLTLLTRTMSGVRRMSLRVRSSAIVQLRDDTELGPRDQVEGEVVHESAWPIERAFRAEFSAVWTHGEAKEDWTTSQNMDAAAVGQEVFLDSLPKSPNAVSLADEAGTARIQAAFGILARHELVITDVRLAIDDDFANMARTVDPVDVNPSAQQQVRQSSLGGQWREGDRWGSMWDVQVDLKQLQDKGIPGPSAHLVVTWQRASDKAGQALLHQQVTRLPMPILAPPHMNPRVLVASPPVAQALQAFTLVFVVVNPSAQPADVSLMIEDGPSWMLSHRTLTIPGVPARGSRSVPTRIVPRTQGTVDLPRVRAFQQRSPEAIEATGGLLLLNENKYGVPLLVRYRASVGATVGPAAQRALAAGHRSTGEEGASLAVVVLPPEGEEAYSGEAAKTGAGLA